MQNKRITRSRNDRALAGVASGLATYLNIDPVLVRLGFLALSLVNGLGILLYVVLWVLLPNEDTCAPDTRSHVQENPNEMQATAEQLVDRVREVFQR
ncbi:MAG: PspC domain-containing protein [Chloroflexales bacterium]|nr:PspC domain-containing protein [Chloroflexales bacterium]